MSWFKKKPQTKVVSLSNGKYVAMIRSDGHWRGIYKTSTHVGDYCKVENIVSTCQVASFNDALDLIDLYLTPSIEDEIKAAQRET